MSAHEVYRSSGWEDTGAIVMARVTGTLGTAVTQASLSSIDCKVFDLDGTTPDTPSATPTVTVSTSVYDALQLDSRWSDTVTGYNFIHELPASAFPTGDRRYRIEYVFTPASGQVFAVVVEHYAQNLRGS